MHHGSRSLIDPPEPAFNTIPMMPITPAFLLLLSRFVPSLAQEATQASPGTACLIWGVKRCCHNIISPELEEKRAECLRICHRNLGRFSGCPLGKEKCFECWSGQDDWGEREENCV